MYMACTKENMIFYSELTCNARGGTWWWWTVDRAGHTDGKRVVHRIV